MTGPLWGVHCSECRLLIAPTIRSSTNNGPALCLDCLAKRPQATFGERVKAYRLAAGLTQEMLARLSGSIPYMIRRYEQDRAEPMLTSLLRIVRVLGIGVIPQVE